MDLNKVNIEKLPADVRKTFKQMQLLLAEKKIQNKAKNLIDSEDYGKIFQTRLQEDSKAAGRWETAQGGEYFAAGVGGAITGRGADLLIIDDPHSEQDAMSPTALESAYEWYTSGPRQRLQPGGKIILVMTRWSNKDLTG